MRHNDPSAAPDKASVRRKGLPYLFLTLFLALISGLSIWFIGRIFGGGEFVLSLSFITPVIAAEIAGFLLVYFLFDSLRFYCALRTLGLNIPFWYIVRLTFINVFVSAITPFAAGGGFLQIYFLSKRNVPLGKATAAATIRTLLGVSVFFIAVPIVLIVNPALFDLLGTGYTWILGVTAAIFSVIIIALVWIVFNERNLKRVVFRFLRFLRKRRVLSPSKMRRVCVKLFSEIRSFNAGLRLFFGGSKKFMLLSFLSTGMFLFMLFSLPILLTRAMGYQEQISPAFIYQAMIVITFVTYFAFTPGAAGLAEGGFALMFSGSVNEGDIASLTLLWRSLSVYVGTLVGLVLFYIEVLTKPKKRGEKDRDG
ncbi:MAG: flippase-like domain-containing protein [Oscillospiraceae bacterium]|nr:flippase-like domain-containing protein [Oscillospiraceae bacterium]